MSFESCSKKRPAEEDVDQQPKPAIDDFCRKKFKPIAPKPCLKTDQHRAVVLTTLPVKNSYLEENDSCKVLKSGQQVVLMSPQHMHLMSNLPVMLHAPTLLAMNSCSTIPVLANYSFVIPVGCGHCNCSKSIPPVLCTAPQEKSCSHCHSDHCCKTDLQKDLRCKSYDGSSKGDLFAASSFKSIPSGGKPIGNKGQNDVPILPLNASLPSNLNDILKLRPEKYKYSMLLNNPGAYNQIAVETAKQSQILSNWPVSVHQFSKKKLQTVTTSHASAPATNQMACSVSSVHTTSYATSKPHYPSVSTTLSSSSSSSTHSRSSVLPSVALSSTRTVAPSNHSGGSLHNNYIDNISTTKSIARQTVHTGPTRPLCHRNSNVTLPGQPNVSGSGNVQLVLPLSVEKPHKEVEHNETHKTTQSDSRILQTPRSCNASNIPFTKAGTTMHSIQSRSSSGTTTVSMNHSNSSAQERDAGRNNVQNVEMDTIEHSLTSQQTIAPPRKRTRESVDVPSVPSKTVPNLQRQTNLPVHKKSSAKSDAPTSNLVLHHTISASPSNLHASRSSSINTVANLNVELTTSQHGQNTQGIRFSQAPMQQFHHGQSHTHQNPKITTTNAQVHCATSKSLPTRDSNISQLHVAPRMSSQCTVNRPLQTTQHTLLSMNQNNPDQNSRKSHVPFSNTTGSRSSAMLSNVTATTDVVGHRRNLPDTVVGPVMASKSRMSESTSPRHVATSTSQIRSSVVTSNESSVLRSLGGNTDTQNRHQTEQRTPFIGSGKSNNAGDMQINTLLASGAERSFENQIESRITNSSASRREWSNMTQPTHVNERITVPTDCHRNTSNSHQQTNVSTESSCRNMPALHNPLSHAQGAVISSEHSRRTSEQHNATGEQNHIDSDLPDPTNSDPRNTQTVPLHSNIPAPSRQSVNNVLVRKLRQRCCLPRQEETAMSSGSYPSTAQPGQVEPRPPLRTSCSTGYQNARVSVAREQSIIPPLMSNRLEHNHSVHNQSKNTAHLDGNPSVATDHAVPHPMLYNFSHMLNSQSDVQRRLSMSGGIGRHSITNHINHLQECNIPTSPHNSPHSSLHQSGTRHLLVPPPPLSSVHRSLFMSPHPADVNLMSPRSFPSTHMHDNMLYSPASISRLPTNSGYSDRLHTSYPVHYLPEERIDSCCSGGLRTPHSPTGTSFPSPWILSSPSRTPAPPFLPSFPRHNSINNLPSTQEFYGVGASVGMGNITTPHHMPSCMSGITARRHVEPLHIQTDINSQVERDTTGSLQLSPIVTPPPASETLINRPPLRNTSSESIRNAPSEIIINRSNPVNHILATNSLVESSHPLRNTTAKTIVHQPPIRIPSSSSEPSINQPAIRTSTSNQLPNSSRSSSKGCSSLHNPTVLETTNSPSRNSNRRNNPLPNSTPLQPNTSPIQQGNQQTSSEETGSQLMTPSPASQRSSNKYIPIDDHATNQTTTQTPSAEASPALSISEQPVKFNGNTLHCRRQILCESGRTVLCCWHCDFHTAEPKKMHRHQRREEKAMSCQLCNFTGNSRCNVDQHFKENHLNKDDPFTSAVS